MGNCLGGGGGGGAGAVSTTTTTTNASKTRPNKSNKAFQGTGHRLGAAHEEDERTKSESAGVAANQLDSPKPRIDPSLSDSARDRQREERLKAAEERQKKLGGGGKQQQKKKKKDTTGEPLRGPNSQPTMRWTA